MFECPHCHEKALEDYSFDGMDGHRYLSTYIQTKNITWTAIRCPQIKQTIWFQRDTGEICDGEPWTRKEKASV